jgi:hypothetical protein
LTRRIVITPKVTEQRAIRRLLEHKKITPKGTTRTMVTKDVTKDDEESPKRCH